MLPPGVVAEPLDVPPGVVLLVPPELSDVPVPLLVPLPGVVLLVPLPDVPLPGVVLEVPPVPDDVPPEPEVPLLP